MRRYYAICDALNSTMKWLARCGRMARSQRPACRHATPCGLVAGALRDERVREHAAELGVWSTRHVHLRYETAFFLGDSTFTAPRQSTQPDRRIACVRIACPVLRHVPVGCGRQGLGDQLGVLQGLTSMVVPT